MNSKKSSKPNNLGEFCERTLRLLSEQRIPFLVGGAFALREYTGIIKETGDLDIFCKASDYPVLLQKMEAAGYEPKVLDARWIAKASLGEYTVDFIFNSMNNVCPVTDSWFEDAPTGEFFGVATKYMAAEELIWTKAYIQDRDRYDGADIYHIILRHGDTLDWDRILRRFEQHWLLLLGHLINFHFVYPSERGKIPESVMKNLIDRLQTLESLPVSQDPVCMGPLISQFQYADDIQKWGYRVVTYGSV